MGLRSASSVALMVLCAACQARESAVHTARRVAAISGELESSARLAGGRSTDSAAPPLRFIGADASRREQVDGLEVLAEAYPSTDVVIARAPGSVEVFYLLRTAAAPTRLAFMVEHASVEAPRARDATGAPVPVSMRREADRVELSFRTEHATFPVLIDPVVTELQWQQAAWGGRSTHAIAYDPLLQKTVLFGGSPGAQEVTDDTWEWDGASWKQRFPMHRPPPRNNFAMVYDVNRKHVVMFGGGHRGISLPPRTTPRWAGSSCLEAPTTSASSLTPGNGTGRPGRTWWSPFHRGADSFIRWRTTRLAARPFCSEVRAPSARRATPRDSRSFERSAQTARAVGSAAPGCASTACAVTPSVAAVWSTGGLSLGVLALGVAASRRRVHGSEPEPIERKIAALSRGLGERAHYWFVARTTSATNVSTTSSMVFDASNVTLGTAVVTTTNSRLGMTAIN